MENKDRETTEIIENENYSEQETEPEKKWYRNITFLRIMDEKGIFCFLLSFMIPFVIMMYAFSQFDIHPFGKGTRQMLVVDLWHQYFPFFKVVHDKLMNGGSFLYSWQNGMGTNFLGLIAYYAASPLNWISVFFSENSLRDVLTILLITKIGFSGAFFSCFLRYTYGRKDISICLFSAMFALCSYMLGYYWNVMWFDTIALFPLVMTGIVAICRERKWKLYTFSLALSLFSSYYIAYFTCIFCIFMFAAAGIIEPKGIKDFFVKLFIMIRSSVLGIALAAFILLPAYYGLQLTYSANNTFPADISWYEKWTDIFANLLSYNTPVKVEGLPNFYCGMLAVLLFGVFLFSFGIKIREKISVLVMLAVIAVSCNMNKLNFIWHGFHFTNQIPYRFAFIFSFVLVAAAFRAYDVMMERGINVYQLILMLIAPFAVFYLNYRKDNEAFNQVLDIKGKMSIIFIVCVSLTVLLAIISGIFSKKLQMRYYLVPIFVIIWVTFFAVFTDSSDYVKLSGYLTKAEEEFPEASTIQSSFVITTLFFIVFAAAKLLDIKYAAIRSHITSLMLACVLGFELVGNAMLGVKTVDSSDYNAYPDKNTQVQNLLEYERNYEKDNDNSLFYRTEMTGTYTLNDSSLYGYYGISQFSSSANVSVTTLMKRFGMYASEAGNRYCYRISTPVINSLLGVKYIISKRGELNSEEMALNLENENNKVYLYRNKYPLSLGYMMDSKILETEDSAGLNPFEYQNMLIKNATGIEQSCFTAQPVALVEYNNIDVVKNGYGNYTFTCPDTNIASSAKYSYSGVEGAYLYGYATNGGCENLNVSCDGKSVDTNVSVKDYPIIFPMGNGQEGSTANVEIFAKSDTSSGSYKLMIYALSQEIFEEAYNGLADEQLNITKFSDTEIDGDITVLKDGVLFLSMPYEPGWRVYADGEEIETFKVLQSMLGVKLSSGQHNIKIVYTPEGFREGILISASALTLCILISLLEIIRRKKRTAEVLNEMNETATEFSEKEGLPDNSEKAGDDTQSEETEIITEENEVINEKSESNDSIQGD